jgi:hypothetical protein
MKLEDIQKKFNKRMKKRKENIKIERTIYIAPRSEYSSSYDWNHHGIKSSRPKRREK